jgi:hypothetical protein
MCGPIAAGVLTFALGAAQSVASYSAQMQDAQNTQEAATRAYTEDQKSLSLRQMQEADAAAEKSKLSELEQAEAEAEARVQFGAAGVQGVSMENILSDIKRQGARNRQTISENTKMITTQLQQEKTGTQATAESRWNSVPEPSGLSLVAGIGGAALQGYNAYDKYLT